MVIIGAKGHAKEMIQVYEELNTKEAIQFFDNIDPAAPSLIFDKYPVIKSIDELKNIFQINKKFILGLGGPMNRYNLAKLCKDAGGELHALISSSAQIGNNRVTLGKGLNIMPQVMIFNDTIIGEGCLINSAASIHHDVVVGNYCEISPGARLLGNSSIGNFCFVGTNAVVLPYVQVGNNVVIGAGAVVTDNIPDNCLVAGVPGIIKKRISPLNNADIRRDDQNEPSKIELRKKRKIAIMQPYMFPYLGYFQLIKLADTFMIYDDVNFIKQGWINRNNILLNGKAHLINIQLNGASSFRKINELEIKQDNKKLIKTIAMAYKKAPYFSKVMPLIEKILNYEEKNLSAFVTNSIRQICDYLKLETEILVSSQMNLFTNSYGQERVINLTKHLKGDIYINAIGGQDLYSSNDFSKFGIELKFLRPKSSSYTQFDKEFVNNLSIIDVMMFNSVAQIQEFLNEYELE